MLRYYMTLFVLKIDFKAEIRIKPTSNGCRLVILRNIQMLNHPTFHESWDVYSTCLVKRDRSRECYRCPGVRFLDRSVLNETDRLIGIYK